MEKILTSHISEKGLTYLRKDLYPDYIKNSQNLIIENQTTPQKMVKDLNRHYTKEDTQLPSNHKRCSMSLVTREIEIKITMK